MPFIFKCDTLTTKKGRQYIAEMHSHDMFEIYCFLSGQAHYIVEGRRYNLSPGDLIILQKGEVHIVQVSDNMDYRRIVLNFDATGDDISKLMPILSPFYDRPIGKFNHYPAQLFPENHWIFYMEQILRQKGTDTQICYLLPLLCELKEQFPLLQNSSERMAKKDPAAPIMRYINDHLKENLSVDALARQFYTSPSHLNRLFRKSTGTTVWEYITIKRLFIAKQLLETGTAATDVFSLCGFADYSTFFRAYKRHFGVSPSAHRLKKRATVSH